MESLKGIASFVHAAELCSYAEAGRVLGVSASAVSKSITRLEEELGVRLFHRTTRSISMTNEGNVYYKRCKIILNDLVDARAMITASRSTPKGRLRVSVPQIFGHSLLQPMLVEYLRTYPEVELDIDFEDRVIDIIGEGIDVAVRIGELRDSRLIGYKIGEQHFVVCGSHAYFKKHGKPKTPHDLLHHSCIHFKYPSNGRIAQWAFKPQNFNLELPRTLVFNNTHAGLQAALDGFGIAHLPVYVAKPSLELNHLEPILTDCMQPLGNLSLIWPSNRHLLPKVRSFVDFVNQRIRDNEMLSLSIPDTDKANVGC